MAKRLTITARKNYFVGDFISGNLADIVMNFENEINRIKEKDSSACNFRFDVFSDWDSDGIEIIWDRKETPAEQSRRLKRRKKTIEKNKKDKAKKEERERKELARLQKKYG